MEYLHTMVRVTDLDASLDFYVNKLGMVEVRRVDSEKGRFTLVFLAASDDAEAAKGDGVTRMKPCVELTYNWRSRGTLHRRAQLPGHIRPTPSTTSTRPASA